MGGVFTRDERAVILFLAAAVTVGSLVLAVGKVDPASDDASGPADGGPTSPGAAGRVTQAPLLVDVNRAGQDELTLLPGIGPAKAREIVAHRGTRGPFESIDGLDDVRGIGPSTLERLRPFVTLGGARAQGDSIAEEREIPDESKAPDRSGVHDGPEAPHAVDAPHGATPFGDS